jgi:protein-disulfide isomerase
MKDQIKSEKPTRINPDEQKSSKYFKTGIPKSSFLRTGNAFLIIALIIFAFALGMLTNKVIYLEKSLNDSKSALAANPSGNNQIPQAIPTEDLSPKQVSIDDDPVLGDNDAKVTLIDFSDYECPFCKRYFDQTYSQIKKEYIDTGKIKYVFRDLPLSFHDPLATLEAVAANCARAQGDDTNYYEYHDEIFKRTKSNGNGLTKDDLTTIASDLGLDTVSFTTCVNDEKNKEEVQKDLADATKVGASGTPTFFIGKSNSNGIITGTKLVGAQPFDAFKKIIDQELSK